MAPRVRNAVARRNARALRLLLVIEGGDWTPRWDAARAALSRAERAVEMCAGEVDRTNHSRWAVRTPVVG